MLPLDHIPFYDANADNLARGFARLGFTVSPPGVYTAPDHPKARWPSRSVFLKMGWFDLLPDAGARLPGAPAACLFRAPDLAAACEDLAVLRPEAPFRLERRWLEDLGLPVETFAYSGLRSRVAPVGVAVIAHAWPCVDILPEWFEHPNGAQQIAGLVFGGDAPGPDAPHAGRVLDLSALEYWTEAAFDAAFPGAPARRAVRVRVDDLAKTRRALAVTGARFAEAADGIAAPAQGGLNCGVLFCL